MSIIKRGLIHVVIAAHLCACAPVPVASKSHLFVSDAQRDRMGSVGVVALASTPQGVLDVGTRGRIAGAVHEAGQGAAAGGGAVLMHGCGGGEMGCLFSIILLPVFIVGGAVIGAVDGGMHAVPEVNARKIEAQLRTNLAEADEQGNIRIAVMDASAQAGVQNVREIPVSIPTVVGQGADYRQLPDAKVDTILEVGLLSVSFIGRGGADPELSLNFKAVARLVDEKTNTELYKHVFAYSSGPRKFSEWNADQANLIKEAFKIAYRSLGQTIVDEIFLIERTN
jgi:hypothetical protein